MRTGKRAEPTSFGLRIPSDTPHPRSCIARLSCWKVSALLVKYHRGLLIG